MNQVFYSLVMDWKNQIEKIDSLIKGGRGADAQVALLALKGVSVPRQHLSPIADLARRARLPFLSLIFLARIVRSSRALDTPPTNRELITYGASLVRVGAINEGINILEHVPKDEHPEALLQISLGHISKWQYSYAIPALKKYIKSIPETTYPYVVGQINLAASYIYTENFENSARLLEELRERTKRDSYILLHGTSLELSAILAISRGDFKEARHYLELSKKTLSRSNSLQEFFVRKWLTISSLLEGRKSSLEELAQIRKEAIRRRHWETLRECDFYEALCTNDLDIVDKLAFGTPYPSYQNRIKESFQIKYDRDASFVWKFGPSGLAGDDSLMKLDNETFSLPGKTLHRALQALCQDFYRPIRIGQIHDDIFPDQYFNPLSSPGKVAKIIQRLRKHFEGKNIPLKIISKKNEYYLSSDEPYGIELRRNRKITNKEEILIRMLKKQWPYQSFSAREVATFLDISPKSAQRFLKRVFDQNRVYVSGNSRSICYRFAK